MLARTCKKLAPATSEKRARQLRKRGFLTWGKGVTVTAAPVMPERALPRPCMFNSGHSGPRTSRRGVAAYLALKHISLDIFVDSGFFYLLSTPKQIQLSFFVC